LQGDRSQKTAGRLSLAAACGVERDVDLALESALTVPVRLPMTNEHESWPPAPRRQGSSEVGCAVEGFNLHSHSAISVAFEVENRDRGVVETQSAEGAQRELQQADQQAAEDGVMRHHQQGLIRGSQPLTMGAQQPRAEAVGLLAQLFEGVVGLSTGALEHEGLRCFPPELFLLGMELAQLLAEQAGPGGEVDLQQVVIRVGGVTPTMDSQQFAGRITCPAQR
jgi:hypothetical protein